jgi:AcrR family transcriptional regulator
MAQAQEERKEQWAAMMKESLHRAVVRVLIEEGWQGLTMERVTQAAGMAKGTLYNYFKDKDELLRYAVQSSLDPLDEEIDKVLGSGARPDEKLKAAVLCVLKYFDENRAFFRVLLDPELSGPRMHPRGRDRQQVLIMKISRVYEEGVKQGLFRPLPADKAAAMLVMSSMALVMGRMRKDEKTPVEQEAALHADFFLHGVAARGGEAL